jgi:hypothetical protein
MYERGKFRLTRKQANDSLDNATLTPGDRLQRIDNGFGFDFAP